MPCLALVLAAIAGCEPPSPAAEQDRREPGGSDVAVQEAALRAMLSDRAGQRAPVACIQVRPVGWAGPPPRAPDPPKSLIERFAFAGDTVVGGSECEIDTVSGRMIHVPSGDDAVLYSLGAPVWHGSDSAEVSAGWGRASLWGRSCRYVVLRDGDGWRASGTNDCIEH